MSPGRTFTGTDAHYGVASATASRAAAPGEFAIERNAVIITPYEQSIVIGRGARIGAGVAGAGRRAKAESGAKS